MVFVLNPIPFTSDVESPCDPWTQTSSSPSSIEVQAFVHSLDDLSPEVSHDTNTSHQTEADPGKAVKE